jgi:hypothetical protein
MNRAQRRAQAKKHGRTTERKAKAPRLFATVTDDAGNEKRIELSGEQVSEEEVRAAQHRETERLMAESKLEEERMRFRGHVHGLWMPGDPL